MMGANLEEFRSADHRKRELSILEIFNPRFIGKLGNEAGGECRVFSEGEVPLMLNETRTI